jgi:hypothetical protein
MTRHDIDDDVRRLFGEPPEDPAAKDRARARLPVEIADHRVGSATRPARRRWGLRIAIVALACSTVLMLIVLPLSRPSSSALALGRLSQIASKVPPPTKSSYPAAVMQVFRVQNEIHLSGNSYALLIRSSIVNDLRPNGSVRRTETIESVAFAGDADEQAWAEAGRPALPQVGDEERDTLSVADLRWFNADAISSDPRQLLDAIRSGHVADWPTGDDQAFLLIGELLAQPGLSAEQRSSLYQAAASIPGVQLLGDQTDPVGRSGQGFSVESAGRQTIIIFDPDSGQPLATEGFYDGQLTEWNAFGARS